jgi:hypothetical protein
MAFSHSKDAHASRSTFNDVGRDQHVFSHAGVHIINYTVVNSPSISEQTAQHPPWPTSCPRTSLQGTEDLIPMNHSSVLMSILDTAVGLIVDIVSVLHIESVDEHQHLERELKLLSQSLILTRSALQVYEHTLLGHSLAKTIYPEVTRCHVVLTDMHAKTTRYRESLHSTSIRGLWHQVWLSGWDRDELAKSRMELSSCQEPLNSFLVALNSYVLLILQSLTPTKKFLSSIAWTDLGNELRTGQVSIARFYHSLSHYMLPLRHIQINKVLVVDHLGRNIPVPTLFCSTWKVDLYSSVYQ